MGGLLLTLLLVITAMANGLMAVSTMVTAEVERLRWQAQLLTA